MRRILSIACLLLLPLALVGQGDYFYKRVAEGQTLCFRIVPAQVAGQEAAVAVTARRDTVRGPMAPEGRLHIPEQVFYDGERYAVTMIDDSAFRGAEGLTAVTLPAPLHTVGDHAFDDCPKLRTLTVECDSLGFTFVAFGGTTRIDSLIVGAEVRRIAPYTFSMLTHLETVIFNAEHAEEMRNLFFGNAAAATLYVGSQVGCIPDFLCYNFGGLRRVVYAGDALTAIGEGAFVNCKELRTLLIPKGVDDLGSFAFAYCEPQQVLFEPQQPPRMRGNPFFGMAPYVEVTVPCGTRQHYVNTVAGSYFNGLQYPDDCPLVKSGEVVYVHDTVWIHDTIYVEVAATGVAQEAQEQPTDWLRIEGRQLIVLRGERLAGRTYQVFDHNGRRLRQGRVPYEMREDYAIELPKCRRYYVGFDGEPPVVVDVETQEIKW